MAKDDVQRCDILLSNEDLSVNNVKILQQTVVFIKTYSVGNNTCDVASACTHYNRGKAPRLHGGQAVTLSPPHGEAG